MLYILPANHQNMLHLGVPLSVYSVQLVPLEHSSLACPCQLPSHQVCPRATPLPMILEEVLTQPTSVELRKYDLTMMGNIQLFSDIPPTEHPSILFLSSHAARQTPTTTITSSAICLNVKPQRVKCALYVLQARSAQQMHGNAPRDLQAPSTRQQVALLAEHVCKVNQVLLAAQCVHRANLENTIML